MSRHVSYRADVRRRVREVLLAIAPDAPFPTRVIVDVISVDTLTGGPYDRVFMNMDVAEPTTNAAIIGVKIPNEIVHDVERGTIAITSAGQALVRTQVKGMPPTPQARARQKNGADDVGCDVLVEIHHYASYRPGVTSPETLPLDHLGLVVPHFLHLSRADLEQPNKDWGFAQNLATLWLLNDHGVVPEHVLAEHTHELLTVCAQFYPTWDCEAASMLLQAVEEMINATWAEAETVGNRLLDMAEAIIPTVDDATIRWRLRKDARALRQKLNPTGVQECSMCDVLDFDAIKDRWAATTPGEWKWVDAIRDVPYDDESWMDEQHIPFGNDGRFGVEGLYIETYMSEDSSVLNPVLYTDDGPPTDPDHADAVDWSIWRGLIHADNLADLDFIVNAKTDIAALIREVERLQALVNP